MPEGDTIFRTATSLRTWIGDRVITAAAARDPRLGVERLIGRTVIDVSTHGKHLFLEFASDSATSKATDEVVDGATNKATDSATGDALVLRTHMMMTGSWHVYRHEARWRRPARQMVISLTAGDRVAVCFNAPVVELLTKRRSHVSHELAGYGPDILADPLDIDAIIARGSRLDPATPVGVTLLDQHVVAGIGNIYRCESLFQRRISPFAPQASLTDSAFGDLVHSAAGLMHANLSAATSGSRSFGSGDRPFVYGRSGRPCRVCGNPVQSTKLGRQLRTVYWCGFCQPDPGA